MLSFHTLTQSPNLPCSRQRLQWTEQRRSPRFVDGKLRPGVPLGAGKPPAEFSFPKGAESRPSSPGGVSSNTKTTAACGGHTLNRMKRYEFKPVAFQRILLVSASLFSHVLSLRNRMSKETKPQAAHLATGESGDRAIAPWTPERGSQDRVWAPLLKYTPRAFSRFCPFAGKAGHLGLP